MTIELIRTKYSDNYTEGHINIKGFKVCDTLEPAISFKDHPCIPEGSYKVVRHYSHRFSGIRPLIDNVPGRKYILIHEGNTPHDSIGCVLVGMKSKDAVLSYSKSHLNILMFSIKKAWKNNEEVVINIHH